MGRSVDDRAARALLIERHLPLVQSLARRYANRGEGLDDLVQIGAIGLIKAVDRFDPGRGVPLAAFAVPNIEGEIRRHLRDRASPIRLPRAEQDATGRLRRARDRLAARLARMPTSAELAAEADLHEDDFVRALAAERVRTPVPLVAAAETAAGDAYDASERRVVLEKAMEGLHSREREALRFRFFGDLSQYEIARRLGISQTHASRLIASALAKLRADLADSATAPGVCTPAENGLHSEHGHGSAARRVDSRRCVHGAFQRPNAQRTAPPAHA